MTRVQYFIGAVTVAAVLASTGGCASWGDKQKKGAGVGAHTSEVFTTAQHPGGQWRRGSATATGQLAAVISLGGDAVPRNGTGPGRPRPGRREAGP